MDHSNKGQTFFEFLFLLLIMFVISLAFFKGTNYAIGKRWVAIVKLVTAHDLKTPPDIELR